jgi:ribose transport system ATP-binding protein
MTDASCSGALEIVSVERSFPGVRALRNVSFSCQTAEIHGLVGENGAGKTTLVRILAGALSPDAGTIRLNGQGVSFTSPRDAQDHGIATVYQDTRLVADLDIAQNILLGREPGWFLHINRRELEQRTEAMLDQLGVKLDLRRLVSALTTAQRQIVETARALAANPTVLILDEPSSALDSAEIERLAGILRSLRARGTGIVYISHRLREVLALADRITVLKDGEVVFTARNEAIDEDELVSKMVGRRIALAFPPKTDQTGATRLKVNGLSSPGYFKDVTFVAAAGEIVGLGGIQGNGQREILRALFGLLPTSGRIQLDGKDLLLGAPRAAVRAGVIYVSADRRGEALFGPLAVRANISAPHLSVWSRLGVINRSLEATGVARTIERFQIRTPSPEQRIALLSGGNQQKVVMGRWVIAAPAIYLLDEPTLGVDVATKLELYRVIRKLAAEGAAVVLLTSDLLELIGLSDRILVVAHGAIVDEIPGSEATEEKIIGTAVRSRRRSGQPASGREVPAKGQTAHRVGLGAMIWRRYSALLFLAGMILALSAYTAAHSPYFFTPRNLGNFLIQIVPLALVAVGQMTVILLGGIDLSIGPSISLVTALASYLVLSNGHEIFGVFACVLAALGVAALNCFFILLCGIPDLVSTLATYSIVFGLALLVRPSPGGHVSDRFSDLITMRTGFVPIASLLVLLLALFGEYLLVTTRIGSRLYATGSNREAAFVAGIRVGRVRCLAYLFCGLMAGLAGLVIAARIGSGDAQAGTQFTLASVTAVVVGGTSVFGGRGTIIGTLLGAAFLVLMQNALNQLHVSAYYQYILTGLLLLIAVALYSAKMYRWRG